MHEYSQAVSGQGAAVLMDGQPMTIEQIIQALSDFDRLKFNASASFAVLDKLRGELEQMKHQNSEMIRVIMKVRTGISKEDQAKVLLDAATESKVKQLEDVVASLRRERDQWESRCLKEASAAVDLGLNLDEHRRLHRELGGALGHDAEAPSLCDLVAVARLVNRERDHLAASMSDMVNELGACQAILHQLAHYGHVSPDYARDAKAALERAPRVTMARIRAEAIRRAANDIVSPCASNAGEGSCDFRALLDYADKIEKGA